MTRRRLASAAALVLAGCHGCPRAPAPAAMKVAPLAGLLGMVPADGRVVVLPELGPALTHAGELVRALGEIPGGEQLTQLAADLTRQVGADVRTPEGLRSLGLDPAGPAAIFWAADSRAGDDGTLILPVADAAPLLAKLGELAARVGAKPGPPRAMSAEGLPQTSAFETPGGRVVLTTTLVAPLVVPATRWLLIRRGAPPAAFKSPEYALAARPDFLGAAAKVGPADALVSLSLEMGFLAPSNPVVVGLRLSDHGAKARLVVPLILPALGTAALTLAAPPAPCFELPADAPLTVRLGVSPKGLGELLGAHLLGGPDSPLAKALRTADLDLQRDLFNNLQPGAAVALRVAEKPDLGQLSGFDLAAATPFSLLRLRAFGRVRDPAAARAVLERLPRLGSALDAKGSLGGVAYAWHPIAGQRVLTAGAGSGEISVALVEDRVVVTGGAGEMAAALSALKAAPVSPDLLAARLDPQALSAAIVRLSADASGGLAGLTLRSMSQRLIDPLEHFGAATLNVTLDQGGTAALVAELDVPLK